ncbi:hypothetical protein H310_00802 [Aphanomyces invadans]|uniref:Uncharacterized protein n=1 Tax=Aphanomyces invadans TaxID=157072 RepID=A0A024UXU6_9STRA|nr:hypothetical protein H310_00802 [Aphanomyces invadans]ETW10518.1 hypothetical protein H310_00802 [Aphanomyces invadans]|eukprot:XP_008861929.1 hypothetical protein H310_00802 [Aphanomyces invadans]
MSIWILKKIDRVINRRLRRGHLDTNRLRFSEDNQVLLALMVEEETEDEAASCTAHDVMRSLLSSGCRLVCVDFDSTFLQIHTNGEWSRPAKELLPHVRPLFARLLPLLAAHVALAVVTFSPQVPLIREVLSLCFGPTVSESIIVRGDVEGWTVSQDDAVQFTGIDGHHLLLHRRTKLPYVASAALEASSSCEHPIRSHHTVLIDDCQDNVFLAAQCGIAAVHYDPAQFPQHIHAVLKRRKRRRTLESSKLSTAAPPRTSTSSPTPSPRRLSIQTSLSGPRTSVLSASRSVLSPARPSEAAVPRQHYCTPSPVTKLRVTNSIGKPKPKRYTKLLKDAMGAAPSTMIVSASAADDKALIPNDAPLLAKAEEIRDDIVATQINWAEHIDRPERASLDGVACQDNV